MHSVGCAKQSIALLKAGITRILRGAMRPSCGPVAHKKQKTRLFFAEEEYQIAYFLGIRSCRLNHRLPKVSFSGETVNDLTADGIIGVKICLALVFYGVLW